MNKKFKKLSFTGFIHKLSPIGWSKPFKETRSPKQRVFNCPTIWEINDNVFTDQNSIKVTITIEPSTETPKGDKGNSLEQICDPCQSDELDFDGLYELIKKLIACGFRGSKQSVVSDVIKEYMNPRP